MSKFAQAVAEAKPEDLAELDLLISSARETLSRYESARDFLARLLGLRQPVCGEPPADDPPPPTIRAKPAAPAKPEKPDAGSDNHRRIVEYLRQHAPAGAGTAKLSAALNLPAQSVGVTCSRSGKIGRNAIGEWVLADLAEAIPAAAPPPASPRVEAVVRATQPPAGAPVPLAVVADRVYRYLLDHTGGKRPVLIATALTLPVTDVIAACEGDPRRFRPSPDGWHALRGGV